MRRVRFIVITVILVVLSVLILDEINTNKNSSEHFLRERIYSFLKEERNQREVFKSAVALNNGSSENTCVYFISELLRKNNFEIPRDTCNTSQIISILQKKGWKKDTDYRNLKPGDICFTTDFRGNTTGAPTHTYVFMGWVKEGSYEYAYICDNQAKDYENKVYHIRNIKESVTINGLTKDAFSFFMKTS